MAWMVNLERTIRRALVHQTDDLHAEEDARLGPEPGGFFQFADTKCLEGGTEDQACRPAMVERKWEVQE